MNWLTAAGSFVAAILGGAGFTAVVQAVASRKQRKVDAADKLSEGSVDWALELKADASEARKEARGARVEAHSAREEATAAHREMRALTREVEALTDRLRQWRLAILADPTASPALRAMVEVEPPRRLSNGSY